MATMQSVPRRRCCRALVAVRGSGCSSGNLNHLTVCAFNSINMQLLKQKTMQGSFPVRQSPDWLFNQHGGGRKALAWKFAKPGCWKVDFFSFFLLKKRKKEKIALYLGKILVKKNVLLNFETDFIHLMSSQWEQWERKWNQCFDGQTICTV